MPENINWNAVMQSITDFWLPLLGCFLGIVAVIVVVLLIKWIIKRKNEK